MALRITEDNGIFEAAGPLNASTSESFRNHLERIAAKYKKVTINIDKVDYIDASGLSLLREFYLNGLRYNRDFSIIGYGCKEIYEQFKFEKAG